MHLNSVDPDGTISLRDAPFTLCGNRGPIDHDGNESAWEFRRLSRLGERMESWKRSELGTRGIRLS